MKKILSLILAIMMVMGLMGSAFAEEEVEVDAYTLESELVYELVLGEFYETYQASFDAATVSERYALMALAEAKLMESGVMFPTSADGGNYAISRVAPYSIDYTMWGNDDYRYHQALVCDTFLRSEERAEMKAMWGQLRGTGTYEAWAKQYLADHGYTLQDTYSLGYSSDPQTWDVLATSRAADSEAIINTYDGLVEYDVEGTLAPALAESWTISEDGLTYTFNLRPGLVWVDSQGREVADVKADDFVAGMQHMMDAKGGLESLVYGKILNAEAYCSGELTDFDAVGVAALDDLTLVYTLEAPCSYFMTMLGYGLFAPMSREYYTSQGGQFGADFDPSAETYSYGVDADHIAYCGPYLVTNATAENTIVFTANPTYWNAENINVTSIVWLFNDGSDPTKAYNDACAGILSGCGLNASALELAKADGNFDAYGYVTTPGSTSYMGFYNVNRAVFANVADPTTVVSPMTEEQAALSGEAMLNQFFRLAVSFAIDRAAYNAQAVGEELKLVSLRNSYTPGHFVVLEEEVTIEINGEPTTYAAGTYYGQIMQDQLNADGCPITVWDPTANDGIGSGDGFDGWYNPEAAVTMLNAAAESMGIVIDAEHPVYLDLPYPSNSTTYTQRAQAIKQSVESVLGGAVIVNLVECVSYREWYFAGYYTDYGYEANYSIYDLSGWGPDYGDPSTYLDTFLPDYDGYMIKCIGIY